MERIPIQIAIVLTVLVTIYIVYKITRESKEHIKRLNEFKNLKLSSAERVDKYIKQKTLESYEFKNPIESIIDMIRPTSVSQTLIDELLLAARFALVAYETDEKLLEQQCVKLGASYVGSCNNENCFMFVGDMGHTQILGIQGTEFVPGDWNIYEVWSDLSVTPQKINGVFYNSPIEMYVHSGFYDDLVSLWPQVSMFLDYNRPIHICCHSLGGVRGALARYLIPRTTPVRITNFGAPKGANDEFWNYVYNNKVSSQNTIIERVLADHDFGGSWQPLLPYTHPTEYFYWLNNGRIDYVNKRDEVNLSFDDHSILNSYIPKLLALSSTPK